MTLLQIGKFVRSKPYHVLKGYLKLYVKIPRGNTYQWSFVTPSQDISFSFSNCQTFPLCKQCCGRGSPEKPEMRHKKTRKTKKNA